MCVKTMYVYESQLNGTYYTVSVEALLHGDRGKSRRMRGARRRRQKKLSTKTNPHWLRAVEYFVFAEAK